MKLLLPELVSGSFFIYSACQTTLKLNLGENRLRHQGFKVFTDEQVRRGIQIALGRNPPHTPSTRILRNVGGILANLRDSGLKQSQLIESAVRSATTAKPLEPAIFALYVLVATQVVEHLQKPRAGRARYDSGRSARPQPQMSQPAT